MFIEKSPAACMHLSPLRDAFGTIYIAACFAAGMRIATPDGEAAVEDLRIGGTVLTARG